MATSVAHAAVGMWVNVEDLHFSESNPNIGDSGAIYTSIGIHGYNDTIHKWRENTIKGGEHRIRALLMHIKEGLKPRAIDKCWRLENGVHQVTFHDIEFMEEAKANAFMLALNRTQRLGEDDPEKLVTLLQELANEDLLAATAFSGDDLDDLLRDLNGYDVVEDEPQMDRAAELQEKWQVQTGDLWIIPSKSVKGKAHRFICGDCTDSAVVARLMDGERATLCHADPPYGMGKEKDGIVNDNLYKEKLDVFQMAWWRVARRHIEDNGSAYIWGNAEDLWRLWYCGGLRDSERLTMRNEIVWNKGSGQGMDSEQHRMFPTGSERALFFMLGEQGFSTNADNYWEGWEPIRKYLEDSRLAMGWDIPTMKRIVGHSDLSRDHWTSKSQWSFPTREVYEKLQNAARDHDAFKRDYDDLKHDFYSTRAYFDNTHDLMIDVWDFQRVSGDERWEHATPKPVGLVARCIRSSCLADEITLDPFLGSGTTLAAAEQTSRLCYGIEIAEKYCAVVLQRMTDSGLTPELQGRV